MDEIIYGNNSSTGEQAQVPDEIVGKFNWGAFLLTWIWGIGNRSWITLISLAVSFVPVIGGLAYIGLSIWFGYKGNEWAWQNKQWDSIEQFNKVQRTWAILGAILSVATTVLITLIILDALSSLSSTVF